MENYLTSYSPPWSIPELNRMLMIKCGKSRDDSYVKRSRRLVEISEFEPLKETNVRRRSSFIALSPHTSKGKSKVVACHLVCVT